MGRQSKLRQALAGLAACSFAAFLGIAVKSAPAQAIIGGIVPTTPPTWNVKVGYLNSTSTCSGALVAERWVLTAAHCAVRIDEKTHVVGSALPASVFLIHVGKSSMADRGGFLTTVDRSVIANDFKFGANGSVVNDLALLHLSGTAPPSFAPLPLRSTPSMVPTGTDVQFFGWGFQNVAKTGLGRNLKATAPGDWAFSDACYYARQLCYAHTSSAGSYPTNGDSGAPAVSIVHGAWIAVGMNSGYAEGEWGNRYGASDLSYLPWIRSVAGLPSVGPNTIVRDSSTGTSWYYGTDGFMKWIPTGAIYNCLRSQGAGVLNTSRYKALSVPEDYTASATCSSASNPPPPRSVGSISLSWSTTHLTWVTMTTSGFTAGSWQYTCNFGSGGNQTYDVWLSGGTQTFDNGRTCYDGIPGDTVWITIGPATSNTLMVGSAAPPPPPAQTWIETVGGDAHTWTNYTNAGGYQGATISAYTSVEISCRLEGMAVQDGDIWWYRIASSPWNNAYYVSADAFYNNGHTSGSLAGTPYVDTAVAHC